jgi:pimeloyl-ACP methyl ester carboxylesterase
MKPIVSEEHRVALRDGGTLEYMSAGRGLPVLLINGLGGPRSVWDRLIAHLGDRYRFLAWDYRGLVRGGAEGARSVSEHAADALAILDAEKVGRAALVGWSIGVQVALEVFHRAPEQVASLVMINGAPRATWAKGGDAPLSGKLIARALRLLQSAPGATALAIRTGLHSPEAFTWARRLGLIGERVSAEVFARITRSFLAVDVPGYLETLRRAGEHDGSDVLRHIDVPALIVAADRDPFTSRAAMEQLVHEIAGAEYLALPGAGHFALLDHEERVNLRIEKFWNERGYRAEGRASVLPVPPF